MLRLKSLPTFVCFFLISSAFISNHAVAATLSSSSAWADDNGSYFGCTVTNISSKDVKNVTIEMVDGDGVKASTTLNVLGPNKTEELMDWPVAPGSFKFCKVRASKASVRATLNVYRLNNIDNYYLVLGTYPLH